MSVIKKLYDKKLLTSQPKFVTEATQYEVIMGSNAYGVSDDTSDMDIYGFCIPPKDVIFPHLGGVILGFDKNYPKFEQFQQHHVIDKSAMGGHGREYDFSIYSIVKYFSLCMDNNPNMIDSLFVPRRCILHSTAVGNMVRENRKLFLHKGSFHKFKGYSFSQLHKIKTKKPRGSRKEVVDKYGYDLKFAYHVVRLLDEVEQILMEGDIDLERNREQLKSVRRGDWKLEDIIEYFEQKEKSLEKLYIDSKLQAKPDVNKIKDLLLNCLEQHFGNLDAVIVKNDAANQALKDISKVLGRFN